jgi:hypothetical protein
MENQAREWYHRAKTGKQKGGPMLQTEHHGQVTDMRDRVSGKTQEVIA